MLSRLLAVSLIFSAVSARAADSTQNLRDLLAAEWEYTMEHSPTWASQLGDRRYNTHWPDMSVAALEKSAEYGRDYLAQLEKIDREQLPAAERVNYDLAKYENELGFEEFAARLWTLPVSQREGIQLLDDFASGLRFETVQDYDDWVARLRAVPAYVEQITALLRLGIAEKRTHAKVVMEAVPGQIAKQIVANPRESGFYKPFLKFPSTIPEPERIRLRAAAGEAISQQVVPAYRAFGDFFKTEYLPACTDAVGAWQWPDGDKAYALAARKFTTTKLTPREIHEIGLHEVERIGQEMQRVMDEVKWKGTKQKFFAFLRSDPRFYCTTPEELLAMYRATAKRVDPTLVRVFRVLPRAPYGVEPIPDAAAPHTTAAYYRPLAADGSRAGTYFVNLYRPKMRPKYEMMALTLHEAVPGHHFQFAIAFEQGELPNFRRYGGAGTYTAYIEGWALYAESLGDELGLYDDPYAKFGQLTYEAWRACRLVVDTGMHTMKWTRQQAIDYLLANSAKTELDVENEIDRYISWPGQALGYKIGELKIKELRARAAKTRANKFDVKESHDVVLRSGPVPLEVLERNVDEWLAGK